MMTLAYFICFFALPIFGTLVLWHTFWAGYWVYIRIPSTDEIKLMRKNKNLLKMFHQVKSDVKYPLDIPKHKFDITRFTEIYESFEYLRKRRRIIGY